MKNPRNPWAVMAVGLVTAVLSTSAWGLDILKSKTEAELSRFSDSPTPAIDLTFSGLFADVRELADADVMLTWEAAGGVEPLPFKISIPARCFVRDGDTFFMRDFRRCGVEITFDPGGSGAPVELRIIDFGARALVRGRKVFVELQSRFTDSDEVHAVLGALGGAALKLVIGDASATSLPQRVETVSGVEPIPF